VFCGQETSDSPLNRKRHRRLPTIAAFIQLCAVLVTACSGDAGARAAPPDSAAHSDRVERAGEDRARAADSGAIDIVGDDGEPVRLEQPAKRVVSLIPGRTDAILALGAASSLVARTRYDEDPRLADLPSLQDALTPSVEWLVEQQPDLVIAWPDRQSRSVVTRLRDMGIPVYASNVETVEDVRRAVRALGVLLGRTLAADSILATLDTTIAEVRRSVAGLPVVRVMYLIDIDPPMAAGSGTFIDEMIAMAGGENVLHDASSRWPPVSLEQILARQPDLLLVAVETSPAALLERLRAMPGMSSVEAVREGRIRVLDASLFNRPGPAIIDALRALADAIHPGAPADVSRSDTVSRTAGS
jgi:ABC-type Fe3+-hydroxamate transport system substrate-binding protein